MNAISNLRNILGFHIIFRNRQTLSVKLSSSNYFRYLCHQLWQKFPPDEKLQQIAAEFLLDCNSLTIGARNMQYHFSHHPHFGATHRKVRKERKAQPQCGTRMTLIQRIFTDPCVSVSSAQSVFYRSFSGMKPTCMKVSAFICVHLRFLNWVIFQTGLTGFTGFGFNPVYPVILSNLKCQLPAPMQNAILREGAI